MLLDGVPSLRRSVEPLSEATSSAGAGALADGGVPLRTLLALGVDAAARKRLRVAFGALPLAEHIFGQAAVVVGEHVSIRGGATARALGTMLPVATPLLAALINFQQALEEFGVCSHREQPLVLSEPPVIAVGTCLHKKAAEMMRARNVTHCPGETAVLCGDGVCRDTFIDCFRARCVSAQADALGCRGVYARQTDAR
ncbi:hypothetical protein T492DRAFT_1112260 [Pavlovales sp. CCMP2436]|nr:hypothetical protein T492DRAFT_1112260 [Pavlovales sp. CCMP2436]